MDLNEYQQLASKTFNPVNTSLDNLLNFGLGLADHNIEKLKARYPEGFSKERSTFREGDAA